MSNSHVPVRADSARKEADDMAVAVAPAPAPIDTLDHPQLSDVHVDHIAASSSGMRIQAAT